MSKTTGIAIALGVLLLIAAAYLMFRPSNLAGVAATGAPSSEAELTFITLTAKIDPVERLSQFLADGTKTPRNPRHTTLRSSAPPSTSIGVDCGPTRFLMGGRH